MTTLAAISWGLTFGLLVCLINLCVISTIGGEPPQPEPDDDARPDPRLH